jgi:archaeal chaperonin
MLHEAQEAFTSMMRVLAKTLDPPTSINVGHNSNELQRALPLCETLAVVGGGGAFETYLSCRLHAMLATVRGDVQLVVRAFAEALLAIPQAIADNAGADTALLLSQLRYSILNSNGDDDSHTRGALGFDASFARLEQAAIVNVFEHGIVEPVHVKVAMLRNVIGCACRILSLAHCMLLE